MCGLRGKFYLSICVGEGRGTWSMQWKVQLKVVVSNDGLLITILSKHLLSP